MCVRGSGVCCDEGCVLRVTNKTVASQGFFKIYLFFALIIVEVIIWWFFLLAVSFIVSSIEIGFVMSRVLHQQLGCGLNVTGYMYVILANQIHHRDEFVLRILKSCKTKMQNNLKDKVVFQYILTFEKNIYCYFLRWSRTIQWLTSSKYIERKNIYRHSAITE